LATAGFYPSVSLVYDTCIGNRTVLAASDMYFFLQASLIAFDSQYIIRLIFNDFFGYFYYAIKAAFPKAKNWQQFESLLDKQGISIEYKRKRQADEVQGISFKKDKHSFKGSDVDRRFSYSKLDLILNENSHVQEQQVVIPTETKNTGSNFSENIVSGVADALSCVGGLFDIQPSNQNTRTK
jgi:hypothetical protein